VVAAYLNVLRKRSHLLVEKNIVQKIPEIIRESSKSPMALLVLVIIFVFFLASTFFVGSSESTKIFIFLTTFSCVVVLASFVLRMTPLKSEKIKKPLSKPELIKRYVSVLFSWGISWLIVAWMVLFALDYFNPWYNVLYYLSAGLALPLITVTATLFAPLKPRIATGMVMLMHLLIFLLPVFIKFSGCWFSFTIGVNPAEKTPVLLILAGSGFLVNIMVIAFLNAALYDKSA